MTKLKQIEEFLAAEPVAMVGVSRNPKKFGYAAFRELKEKGLKVIPVNPYASEILGEKVFPDIQALPPEVKSLIIMTRKDQTASIVRAARDRGMKNIWIQQSADTPESKKELEGSGINYITGQCILMYFKPNGVHKFHGSLKKFFGRYPK
jgi:predicted CoA-binding protein